MNKIVKWYQILGTHLLVGGTVAFVLAAVAVFYSLQIVYSEEVFGANCHEDATKRSSTTKCEQVIDKLNKAKRTAEWSRLLGKASVGLVLTGASLRVLGSKSPQQE